MRELDARPVAFVESMRCKLNGKEVCQECEAMGRAPQHERMYEKLNRLLMPGQLKPFVEQHDEFAWEPCGKNGMIIKWA